MVVNASELDTTVFLWALVVVPAAGLVVGVGSGVAAWRRRWRHPLLVGLAAAVAGTVAGWAGMLLVDAVNGN